MTQARIRELLHAGLARKAAIAIAAAEAAVDAAIEAAGGGVSVTDGVTTVADVTSLSVVGATVSDEGSGEAAVGVSVLKRTVTLTDAQIKALPTTPVEVVPAPGASKVVLPIATLVYSHQVAAYTNVTNSVNTIFGYLLSGFGIQGWQGADALLTFGEDAVLPFTAGSGGSSPTTGPDAVTEFEDQPLMFYMDNSDGNLTGGNAANTLKVMVIYTVVDL